VAQVVWSHRALRDLHVIEVRIAKDRPMAAIRFIERLRAAGQSLGEYPDRGRSMARDVRELRSLLPYLIRYRVEPARVTIIEIRHAARRRGP